MEFPQKPENNRQARKDFSDYDGFVEKFKPKKTTDDCYTPPVVYDCVLQYVREIADIDGCEVVRPFYPGGDYENFTYPKNCVVVDNPPFSIISKIVRFFDSKGIKFFLFAPHLTLFSVARDVERQTSIVCCADIIYENGARVKTSFVTNLLEGVRVLGSPELARRLKAVNDTKAASLPKYQYPRNVLTVSMVQWCVDRGVSMRFSGHSLWRCAALDAQRAQGKGVFGSGFLLSEKAAAEKAAAEKEAAEKEAAEKDDVVVWDLSPREIEIINSLR